MKTNELTGAALDWAVARCEGGVGENQLIGAWYAPSTDWAQGGPIIEREGITLTQYDDYPNWSATLYATDYNEHTHVTAPTPLIAAMRCYVASKLGDDINIPEELL
jgi:hypothetical protein